MPQPFIRPTSRCGASTHQASQSTARAMARKNGACGLTFRRSRRFT